MKCPGNQGLPSAVPGGACRSGNQVSRTCVLPSPYGRLRVSFCGAARDLHAKSPRNSRKIFVAGIKRPPCGRPAARVPTTDIFICEDVALDVLTLGSVGDSQCRALGAAHCQAVCWGSPGIRLGASAMGMARKAWRGISRNTSVTYPAMTYPKVAGQKIDAKLHVQA